MKYILSVVLITLFANANAQSLKKDTKAIKAMCGCYEVAFNFAETFNYAKDTANYKPSPNKHAKALEWVQLVEEEEGYVMLQHLLIVGGGAHIIKHWRQDWLYENQDILNYEGDGHWKYKRLPANAVKGQWTQKVYQVDDQVRYEGSGTWNHVDQRHFWESKADAPLARREHTIRSDYNLLQRTNVHEIISNGWLHDQDNKKIIRESGKEDIIIAEEKGHNVYVKVADEKCLSAQKWWEDNQNLWRKVRNKWEEIISQRKDIRMHHKVKDKRLYQYLFALKADATQEEINKIIDSFIIK